MNKRRFSYSTKAVFLTTVVLLCINIAIGAAIAVQSRSSIRQVINEQMLGIAKTAGTMLDGDELDALTKSDVGTKKHDEILDKLRIFSDNFNIKYIYVKNTFRSVKKLNITSGTISSPIRIPKNPRNTARK